MEKKSRVKQFLVVVLFIILLGVVGFLIYDKYNAEKRITDYETQVNDLKKEIEEYKTVKDNNSNVETDEKRIVGYYKWGKTLETENNICDVVTNPLDGRTKEILFKEDGTYELHFSGDCIGGYGGNGIYIINGDKLTLKITDKTGQCVTNEMCDGEYKIEENGTITKGGNEVYSKVDKSELQIFDVE